MNPIPVQSANLTQFGFTTTFKLASSVATFDISPYTLFTPGGAANVIGVCFQVIDPSGSYLSRIDFSAPAIVPSTGVMTVDIPLTSSFSQFGWYSVTGVLRDANGTDYTIVWKVNVCKPVGLAAGVVPGTLAESVDCSAPSVQVSDNTLMTYVGKAAYQVVKTGMFYYPAGTLPGVPFSYTPFIIAGSGNVYTGTYTVRLSTVASYDMGELVTVQVTYQSSLQFTVTCNYSLCQLMCCIETMQATADSCGSAMSANAKEKLAKATVPLLMALTLDSCGKDSNALVKEISTILGCDCQCDAEAVEPKPILTNFEPTVLQGQCATTAVLTGGVWYIKTKNITVSTASGSAPPIQIAVTQTDCNIDYQVTINEYALTGDILNTIKNDSAYLALLNSMITQNAIDYSGIGPNCVINVTTATYTLATDASNAAKAVVNIVIAGVIYNAPMGLSVTNAPGISTWLNSLNKGTFQVSYDGANLFITVPNSNLVISTMTFILSGGTITQQFAKNGATTYSIIKSMIDYLCGLTDTRIGLAVGYTVCTLLPNGQIQTQQVTPGAGVNMATLMTKIAQAFCTSLQNIQSIAQVNCVSIKALFNSTLPVLTDDVLYGSRSGACGPWTPEDMARQYLTFMSTTNQADLLTLLCQVNSRCVTPVCGPVQFMSIEMIEDCPGVTNIIGTITN